MRRLWKCLVIMVLVIGFFVVNVNAEQYEVTDHKILSKAYKELFKGNYAIANVEAKQISGMNSVDPTIVFRAYSIEVRSLVFQEKNNEVESLLNTIVERHSNDQNVLSEKKPVKLSLYAKIFAARERVYMEKRQGNYNKAAENLLEQIEEEEKALDVLPPETKLSEQFRVKGMMSADMGDLYRYSQDCENAMIWYGKSKAFIDKNKEYGFDSNVAIPPGQYLNTKLRKMSDSLDANKAKKPEDEYWRKVDSTLELAEWHLSLGKQYKDKKHFEKSLQIFESAEKYINEKVLPGNAEEDLKEKYKDLNKNINENALYLRSKI